MTDRRYDEEETRRIFDEASRSPGLPAERSAAPVDGPGFTLAELQDIGAEAGIEPARIAAAARALDTRGSSVPAKIRRAAGLPVGVSRSVDLPASFDEDDWNRLVVDLRETFDARGTIRVEGAFRAWNNGNLQALVEPTDEGYQLRLTTRKGNAPQTAALGAFGLVFAVFMTLALSMKGSLDTKWIVPAFIALMSTVGLLGTAIQLPGWAATRERQMEEVAARALLRAAKKEEVDAED